MTTDISSPTDEIRHLEIQPNPASDLISIKLLETVNEGISIDIFDAMGKAVLTIENPPTSGIENTISVQLEPLPVGLYYIKVQSCGHIFSGKFVKM